MPDRLSALDVSFLYLEEPSTPMHAGGVAIFAPPADGFDYDRLVTLIENRIGLVPRYRQKVRWVPGRLASPVWVDDPDFDVAFHVRRSALPRPGTQQQLQDLVGRVQARQLDRNRPLWEMYLVEGLEDGRIAIITKTHHAMVDGISAVDIGQVILDTTPEPRATPVDDWKPRRPPGPVGLLAGAWLDVVRRPQAGVENLRGKLVDIRATGGKILGAAGGLLAAARSAARPAPTSPLNVKVSEQRRFGMARTELDDYKRVRKSHGGTVNDVVLATVAGALRAWLLTRGEPVARRTSVRAMVPVSVRAEDAGAGGNQVSSVFVDLPVGEPDPIVRLQQISFQMRGHKDSNAAVGAAAIVALAASHRRRCTHSAPGWAAACPGGCSTWWSPTCPARSSPCTPPAPRAPRRWGNQYAYADTMITVGRVRAP